MGMRDGTAGVRKQGGLLGGLRNAREEVLALP
jgi:hypothetical protein